MLPALVEQTVELTGGAPLRVLQPAEVAELPDDQGVEWAPLAPYWAVLWRSGVALAREVSGLELLGRRVVELGCGLGVPSLAAARAGAEVLATDAAPEALELVARSAQANGLTVETRQLDWTAPEAVVALAPFDLVLAADVLYEPGAAAPLLELLPRLAPEALMADPGRPVAEPFLHEAARRWGVETTDAGVVAVSRLRFG